MSELNNRLRHNMDKEGFNRVNHFEVPMGSVPESEMDPAEVTTHLNTKVPSEHGQETLPKFTDNSYMLPQESIRNDTSAFEKSNIEEEKDLKLLELLND